MLNLKGRPSLHEHIHKLGPTEWDKTGRQLMRKKSNDRHNLPRRCPLTYNDGGTNDS
jgi:hypothetical protein